MLSSQRGKNIERKTNHESRYLNPWPSLMSCHPGLDKLWSASAVRSYWGNFRFASL